VNAGYQPGERVKKWTELPRQKRSSQPTRLNVAARVFLKSPVQLAPALDGAFRCRKERPPNFGRRRVSDALVHFLFANRHKLKLGHHLFARRGNEPRLHPNARTSPTTTRISVPATATPRQTWPMRRSVWNLFCLLRIAASPGRLSRCSMNHAGGPQSFPADTKVRRPYFGGCSSPFNQPVA
jgi:hypothetical protein